MKLPDASPVVDLIEAFRRSKTMFTAVAFGIFDRTPAELPALASALGADENALERLLDGCISLGLLTREGGLYRNSDVADVYLQRSSPHALVGYVLYSNEVLFRLWTHLEDAVRDGAHRWRQAFGLVGPIFSHFFKTDAAMRDFLMGMHGFGMLSSPAVAAAFDLSRFRKLVDLGGATGHLAAAVAARYPGIEVALFDLPPVIEFARQLAPRPVELIAGDFFADPLPEADLYALGRILHDWNDERVRRLLARIHERLPAGGALLIAEKLLDDGKGGPTAATMQSLNMLVCTEGRERTLPEYRVLLESVGFAQVEGRRTGAPLDAVLALKLATAQ